MNYKLIGEIGLIVILGIAAITATTIPVADAKLNCWEDESGFKCAGNENGGGGMRSSDEDGTMSTGSDGVQFCSSDGSYETHSDGRANDDEVETTYSK
jgi:hypothetical protein